MVAVRSETLVSPKYITARNEEVLVEEMQRLIIGNGKKYNFHSIQQLSNGKFIAWYNEELNFTYTKHLKERSK